MLLLVDLVAIWHHSETSDSLRFRRNYCRCQGQSRAESLSGNGCHWFLLAVTEFKLSNVVPSYVCNNPRRSSCFAFA